MCRGFDGLTEEIIMKLDNTKIFKDKVSKSGIEVEFGDINGKHSEIGGPILDEEIDICTDLNTVSLFLLNNPTKSLLHEGHSFTLTILEQWFNYEWESKTNMTYEEFKTLFNV